jgi:serine/threonine-protein kinase
LHQVGVGALGPVYRTYEPTRDRLVAVKVFRLDIVPEQAQALSIALNRATESSLFHPSIVEPIAAGMEGTVAYRAEEYVAAESLDVAMRHYAPASLEKALPFVTQLAGAIDFARAAGIGHGGLHPRDIFVTPDDARATGFGVVEALEEVGIRAPTRRPYAAPERMNGAKWSTPADVFSLAAIAFELLTARRPAGTGAKIGSLGDGEHNTTIHEVLARAMDDDPARRFPSALAFAAALEAAGRGQSIPAPAATIAVPAAPIAAAAAIAPVKREPEPEPEPVEPVEPLEPLLPLDVVSERALDHADHEERTLFDAALPVDGLEGDDVAAERFADQLFIEAPADEFIEDPEDEEAEPEDEPSAALDGVDETIAPVAVGPHMFSTGEYEPPETSRPAILSFALVLTIGVLVGFGGGYWARDRMASTDSPPPAPAATQASGAPAGAATAETPGHYSEQKTAPPPRTGAVPRPSATPPPVPDDTSSASPVASAKPPRVPGPPATPAVTRGRIIVKSTPSKAGVTINGSWRGRTPLTIDDLPFTRYVIRVVAAGYGVTREELTLNAGNPSQEVNVRLERIAAPAPPERPAPRPATPEAAAETFTGSLFVDSRPQGATVYLDGKSIGVTPLTTPNVPIGSHIVKLEMAGKKPWSSSTRVTAGQTARVTGSLEDR